MQTVLFHSLITYLAMVHPYVMHITASVDWEQIFLQSFTHIYHVFVILFRLQERNEMKSAVTKWQRQKDTCVHKKNTEYACLGWRVMATAAYQQNMLNIENMLAATRYWNSDWSVCCGCNFRLCFPVGQQLHQHSLINPNQDKWMILLIHFYELITLVLKIQMNYI